MFPKAHIRPLALTLLVLTCSQPLAAQEGRYPDTGITALIPWSQRTDKPTQTFIFNETPEARIRFSYDRSIPGGPWTQGPDPTDPTDMTPRWYSFDVDTGTCGIVTNWEKVNLQPSERLEPDPADPTKVTNKGQQYLSSSEILYVGYWVQRQVEFVHSTPVIKTLQPVFAVTEKYVNCKRWEERMKYSCDDATRVRVIGSITTLGIGYGRTYDGQPQGTPDKNPLLNIVSIGDTQIDPVPPATPPATFHPGWRINENGVQVGLAQSIWDGPSPRLSWPRLPIFHGPVIQLGTPANTTVPFPPELAGSNPHTPWSEMRGTVQFPGARNNQLVDVALLLDTGMGWSSIRVGENLATAVRDSLHLLTDNQIASVTCGGFLVGHGPLQSLFNAFTQTYKYINRGFPEPGACWTPEFTEVSHDDRPYFVNTGRNVFKVWGFAFDPWNGLVKLQWRGDTCPVRVILELPHIPTTLPGRGGIYDTLTLTH